MNYSIITSLIGYIIRLEGIFMIPALLIAFLKKEQESAFAFGFTIVVMLAIGFILKGFKRKNSDFFDRDGFITVALGWVVISFFGALPFFISKEIPHFIDCIFEVISGFTTTGASILTDVEAMSKSMLYWRSFTHWLGGMGVLVFLLAIVPMAKGDGYSLFILRAESPGPAVGKLVPKMHQTAKILYLIYIVLTIIEIILLLLGGMPFYDSLLHSFGTAGTGGFGVKNASVGAYNNPYIEMVIAIFMALFGINFNIFYLVLIGEFSQAWRNEELRVYLGIMITSIVVIALNILPIYGNLLQAFRFSSFQVSSIMTTTGFATADFNTWPQLSRCILVILMFLGASAGSTGGGIKAVRILLLMKYAKNGVQQMLHPHSVKLTKMDGKVVEEPVMNSINVFMIVYFMILIVSILFVSFDNLSWETTITAVIACFNNIGPGLDLVGPMGNYSHFTYFSKIVLSFDMLLGRLEIFPILMLFLPSVWKK